MTDAAPGPVFIDETGRRRRVVRLAGVTAAILTGLYVTLVGISLIASPGILSLRVPGLGSLLPNASAPTIAGGADPGKPAGQLLGPRGRRSTGPGTGPQSPGPFGTSPFAPGQSPTPTVTAHPTPRVTQSAIAHGTGSPSPTPKRTGSPTAHPTPRGTGKPTAHPTHTPRRRPKP